MGLNPENEFYPMDTDDFWLLCRGYIDKRDYDLEVIRRQTEILYIPLAAQVKNAPRFSRLWPSGKKENKKDLLAKARAALKRHREEEALRQWKEKNESNTKTRS